MKRKNYSDAEHAAIARAYVRLAVAQYTGEKLSKAAICRGLIAITGRTRGAIEAKFMNLSAVAVDNAYLPLLPHGYVKGYKPAANGAKALRDHLIVELYRNKEAWPIVGQLGSVVQAGALG